MKYYLEAKNNDLMRRRRERYLVIFLFVVICFLTFFGIRVFDLGLDLPISNSIFIFALININVILLLLLLFLTVRNLVKLLFERKKNIMGAKLRTKLVLAFVTLSLLPTVILFFVSVKFISSSIEYWFNLQIEQSLKNSLEVGQDYYNRLTDEVLSFGNNLSRIISYEGYLLLTKKETLEKFVNEKQKEYALTSVEILSSDLGQRALSNDHRIDLSLFKGPNKEILNKTFEKGMDSQDIQSAPHGDLVTGIVPIFSRTESKAVVGLVVLGKFVPGSFVNRLKAISRGLQEYRQLKMLKKPIKISHMIALSIVTLLIIFSSVWFGFYLSKEITIPIQELAEATNRIASGDYDFFIDLEAKDEIGALVNSFNRMTLDLKTGKNKLEKANEQLIRSNFELEQRRIYMEIVLANVAAGVVSADAKGRILTINKSAEIMLNIKNRESIIGKNYKEVLSEDYSKIIDGFIDDEALFKKGFLKKQIKIAFENRRLALLVYLNVLRDDRQNYLGLVAVFEDLSEIEKAQRMAAWREVAARIAHEVKNPLTPIQLSAQRLRKRYGNMLENEEGNIFHECTGMIIRQVEELKKLVNEFSNFARMPASNPAPADIRNIIMEALSLYKEAHKDVSFIFRPSLDVPIFNLDREQIKRVIINLLDNAIEAVEAKGEVVINLKYDKVLQMIRIVVGDNGRGISPEHKSRLFEPYFSTKKEGTGLGLAIANTIITDHNGFIRVQDNKPKGTKFIIELPVRV
ncbi:MAG TPA: ATP-binding protein [Desulfobacteraceae bacterium]|nr:ATP-binding protein [Desulfobacteraceae bacterium]HPJ67830.1 ATP-binding protein [Desulfobacteraceae bacterium]HPQ28169.1 ATP-binding protein [Desulfobacteraceae bacterium]